MLSKFMKTKSAIGTGLTIGAIGLLTAIFNFDPVQAVTSCALIVCEISLYLESRGE
jgi:hypothetical protein